MPRLMSPLVYAALTVAVLTASNGYSQQPPQSRTTDECPMKIDFADTDASENWRAVNDGVMGGRSSGGPEFDDDRMIFKGSINTDGGGFSSVRTGVASGELAEASGLKMRIKSDGRAYKITMRTDVTYRGRLISFQADVPSTPEGKWAEVDVKFDALRASLFGRPLSGARFDAAKVGEIGIIIADGKDGPFKIEIDWIKFICP